MKNPEIFSFIAYSDLGIFKKPDINLNYLTYEFIPKPVVLGMLGAIAGYSGYQKQDPIPEYYAKLNGLRIGIQPLELKTCTEPPYSAEDFSSRSYTFQKMFVTYNNYHGYGSMEEGGNLIVKEQLLIRPSYRIFVEKGGCSDPDFEVLKSNISGGISHFIPYMGKNEFLLSLIPEKAGHFQSVGKQATIRIKTLFFDDMIRKGSDIVPGPGEKFFNIYENYPYKIEEGHYRFKRALYSSRPFQIELSKINDEDYLLVGTDDSNIFLF